MNSGTLAKFILMALVLLLLPVLPAYAATINVDSGCTLAQAINEANGASKPTGVTCEDGTDAVSGGSNGADTIVIPANNDITLTADLPNITSNITINGNNNTINGGDSHRAITIKTGNGGTGNGTLTVVINNLILNENRSPATGNFHGGAILTQPSVGGRATVTLNRVTLRDSAAKYTGGADGQGGAIYCSWTNLFINDSAIFNNRGYQGGGLMMGGNCTATINRSAIYSNTADLNGGGIRVSAATASATINNSTIYGNSSGTAAHYGGGIFISQGATVRLNHVTITGNTPQGSAANSGGGIASRHTSNKVHIRNSIIYGNTKGDCDKTANLLTNTGNIFGSLNNCGAGTGGVSGDPQLPSSPTTPSSATDPPPYFALPAGSIAIDKVTCLSADVGGDEDQRGATRPRGALCDIGAHEGPPLPTPTATATATATITPTPTITPTLAPGQQPVGGQSPDDGDGGEDGEDAPERVFVAFPTWTPTPHFRYSPEQSCLTLQPFIVVNNASSGTSCQRVQGMQIGHPDLVAANPSAVVDIWGWVTPNTEVCFRASSGAIKFIDTTALPRTVADLPVHNQPGGLLCAKVDGAGQVALVDGPPAPSASATPPAYRSLSDCMVLLQYALNLRSAPGGDIIGIIPHNAKLTALERTAGWFKVDYHGARGWIAAEYVVPEGNCG